MRTRSISNRARLRQRRGQIRQNPPPVHRRRPIVSAVVEPEIDGVTLHLRRERPSGCGLAVFGGFWFVGWLVALTFAGRQFLSLLDRPTDPIGSGEVIPAAVLGLWLLIWTVLGLSAIVGLVRGARGIDKVRLTDLSGVTLHNDPPRVTGDHFDLGRFADVRVAEQVYDALRARR